jgi:hypothetical protein
MGAILRGTLVIVGAVAEAEFTTETVIGGAIAAGLSLSP